MTRTLRRGLPEGATGFTLIELLVGVIVLSVASIGTVGVINFATRQVQRSGTINELNALIESDLANVRTANDRLVCNNGDCAIANNDPAAGGYFPAVTDSTSVTEAEQDNIDFFVDLCSYRNNAGAFNVNSGFAAELAALLPAADGRLQRNIAIDNGGHRYTVTYTRPGGDPTILRQVTLVPATVAWCPCVPSTTNPADLCPLEGP